MPTPNIINLVNPYTNETESFFQVTTWWNGAALTSDKLGALYFQDTDPLSPNFNNYFRLAYAGPIPLSRWAITQSILDKLIKDLGGSGGTIYVDQQVSITTDLVIPATVALQFAAGGSTNQAGFSVAATATLTISPNIIAGDYPIFYGTGKVKSAPFYTGNIFWFGVKGGNGVVDDTLNFQRYVNYCAASGGDLVYIRDGRYLVGRIDFTGCSRVMGETINTTLAGLAGQDICYWKSTGETGYKALTDVELKSLRLIVDDRVPETPPPALPLRVGFGGELVTNCAIHMPGGFTYNFDQLFVTSNAGTVPGSCAFFSDGQAYKVNFGTKCEFRSIDYGVIVGVSALSATIQPKPVTSFNAATGTFTMPNSYAANYQMALIWDNSIGDLTGITPRERYYVVNPTVTSFQIAASSGGTPLTFTATTPAPQLYVIQAGSSSIEFACDEWAALHLITATNKCGFSVPNMEQCHFGTFGCQSTKVAVRILNYHSLTRFGTNNISFREIYTEGPQDTVNMVNKEYMRFEGELIVVGVALRVYNKAMINIYASKSYFNGFVLNNADTTINVYGNNNVLTNIGSYDKDGSVNNWGTGNRLSYSKSPGGGDSPRFQNMLSRTTYSREPGGFFPDYLLTGNPNTPYLSENVLFHPASSALFNGTSVPFITYLYDTTPQGIYGYARLTTANADGIYQMAIRNPLGTGSNAFKVNQFFPKGKWRLYALVKSLTVTQNITLAVNQTVATGANYSKATAVTTDWTVISVDCDHTAATDTFTIQISVQSTTEGLDLAYFVVAPWQQAGPGAAALLDFPATTAGASADLTIAVPGAAIGDAVALGIPPASVTPMSSYLAWVSAANTVTIRFLNVGTATQDPAAGNFKVNVFK